MCRTSVETAEPDFDRSTEDLLARQSSWDLGQLLGARDSEPNAPSIVSSHERKIVCEAGEFPLNGGPIADGGSDHELCLLVARYRSDEHKPRRPRMAAQPLRKALDEALAWVTIRASRVLPVPPQPRCSEVVPLSGPHANSGVDPFLICRNLDSDLGSHVNVHQFYLSSVFPPPPSYTFLARSMG
jgi:hypothetical protein